METIRVRVENGQLVGTAPDGLPEGSELELRLAVPDDELDEVELAKLNAALESAWRSIQAGRMRPAAEVIAEIRARR